MLQKVAQGEGHVSGERPGCSIDSQGEASDRDTAEHGSSLVTLKPHQPDPKTIVSHKLADKTLRAPRQWYQDFPWLHFIPGVEAALCFYCRKAFEKKTLQLAKNSEDTFVSTGFKNWKKGREGFASHAQSECHNIALTTQIYETRSVYVQLANVQASQQVLGKAGSRPNRVWWQWRKFCTAIEIQIWEWPRFKLMVEVPSWLHMSPGSKRDPEFIEPLNNLWNCR